MKYPVRCSHKRRHGKSSGKGPAKLDILVGPKERRQSTLREATWERHEGDQGVRQKTGVEDSAEVMTSAGVSSGKASGANSLGRASLNSSGGSGLQGRPLAAWSLALRLPLLRPELPLPD